MNIRASLICVLVLVIPQAIWAETYRFTADNVTGLNRSLGQPVTLFELPNGVTVAPGFDSLGEHNPNGTDPFPLTPATSKDINLATRVDPSAPFANQNIDPSLINVLIRDVTTWTTPNLVGRQIPPPHLSAPAFPGVSQAEPNDPITLGDWFEAEGRLKIKCGDNGNKLKIRVRNLVPNRLYTVWALWFALNPEPGQPRIVPQPLGGVPNAYMTDNQGNAEFKRVLNFCPPELAQSPSGGILNGHLLFALATHLHSDHIAYGGVPAPILEGTLAAMPPGTVLHGQLEWNLGNGIPGPGRNNGPEN